MRNLMQDRKRWLDVTGGEVSMRGGGLGLDMVQATMGDLYRGGW